MSVPIIDVTGVFVAGARFRDTYGDGYRALHRRCKNPRTVQLLSREPDGRWLVECVIESAPDGTARPVEGKCRRSRISESTLGTKFEWVQPLAGDDA